MKNNNLDSKIEVIEDFINRKIVGITKNILLAHLEKVRNSKPKDIKQLRKVLEDHLINTERNNAIRDTELDGFDEA